MCKTNTYGRVLPLCSHVCVCVCVCVCRRGLFTEVLFPGASAACLCKNLPGDDFYSLRVVRVSAFFFFA